ncbi:hypothetical protein AB0C60_11355, partial [Streptomyces sp. NPDC048845]
PVPRSGGRRTSGGAGCSSMSSPTASMCSWTPTLALLAFDAPVVTVLVYAALGALFMPALIAGLLYLMNSRAMPRAHRNKWYTNVAFAGSLAVYAALGVHELMSL